MKFIKYVGILLITSVLTGCYEPTIDASSKETIKTSTQAIRDTLSGTERSEFNEALKVIMFSQIDMKDLFLAGTSEVGKANLENKYKDVLHGKTAKEIIAEAARIKAEKSVPANNNPAQAEEKQQEEITAAQEEDWAEARRKRNLAFFNKNQERILRIAQQALDDKRYNRTLNLTDDYKTSDNPELQRIRKEAEYAIDRGW